MEINVNRGLIREQGVRVSCNGMGFLTYLKNFDRILNVSSGAIDGLRKNPLCINPASKLPVLCVTQYPRIPYASLMQIIFCTLFACDMRVRAACRMPAYGASHAGITQYPPQGVPHGLFLHALVMPMPVCAHLLPPPYTCISSTWSMRMLTPCLQGAPMWGCVGNAPYMPVWGPAYRVRPICGVLCMRAYCMGGAHGRGCLWDAYRLRV